VCEGGAGHVNLGGMSRQKVSDEAFKLYEADAALAGRRDELLATARDAEDKFRHAQGQRGPVSGLRALAENLDSALTAAMQAAYAAQRAQIGARGYDDRIFRRKGMAKSAVRALTAQAEHLLTLRETHRLNGIPDEVLEPAV
jgi:hypothetical protein